MINPSLPHIKTSQAYAIGLTFAVKQIGDVPVYATESERWHYGLISSIGFMVHAGETERAVRNVQFLLSWPEKK